MWLSFAKWLQRRCLNNIYMHVYMAPEQGKKKILKSILFLFKGWNHNFEVASSDEKHKFSLMFVKPEGHQVYKLCRPSVPNDSYQASRSSDFCF